MSIESVLKKIQIETENKTGVLRLSSKDLKKLPSEISSLTHLHSLFINSPELDDISEIISLNNLQTLEINHHHSFNIYPHENYGFFDDDFIRYISDKNDIEFNHSSYKDFLKPIESLTEIKKLSIGSNKIINFASLSSLKKLEDLSLQSDQLIHVNQIYEINSLKKIRLIGKLLQVDFKKLENIESLSVIGSENINLDFSEDMKNLSYLNLSNCNIKSFNLNVKLDNLQYLDLSNNDLSNLDFLINTPNLKNLEIRANKVSNISGLSHTLKLISLSLMQNCLEDISAIGRLNFLQNLYLSDNTIENINPLINTPNVQSLVLSKNRIFDTKALEALEKIEYLDLSHNPITNTYFLKNYYYLKELMISNTEINELDFSINLIRLESLNISNNKVKKIDSISDIKSLVNLHCMFNQIEDLTPLKSLNNIKHIDLEGNRVSSLSGIENLTQLTGLDLSNNAISNISGLKKLTNLANLSLSNNLISDLSPITPLLNLETYIFSSEDSVEPSMDYPHIIFIEDNEIENPPQVILEKGRDAVCEWFEQLEKGGEALFESKVMLLGQGGAGKTTLTRLLIDNNYEVNEGSEDSTLGISIHKNRMFPSIFSDHIDIKGHLWDFGGQDIQKMLHQFFITENCLYIIVHDKRKENTNFDYWFQIINLLGPSSSVIVLENLKSMTTNNYNFPITKYREDFPDLKIDSFEVDLKEINKKDSVKWKSFIGDICEKLSNLKIVNRTVPKKWVLVRDALNRLDKKYITKDEFYEICKSPEIDLSETYGDLCIHYLAGLGEVVYYDENNLSNRIYLDQNWLTKGLYYILSDEKIKENGGKFTRKQAFESWGEYNYNEDEKQMLLSLLLKTKFDICYSLGDSETYITPILLPSDKLKLWDKKTNLHFRYKYSFMPLGIFSRLIVRLNQKIDNNMKWETGVRLVNTERTSFAEVQKTMDNSTGQQVIDIKISGEVDERKSLLSFIRSELRQIHKDFLNINFDENIACICTKCKELVHSKKSPSFFDYNKLKNKVEKGRYFEECPKANFNEVNIGEVLSEVVIEKAGNDNLDSRFLVKLRELDMSLTQITQNNSNHQSINNSANSSATATATAKSHIASEISILRGETESLLEDLEDRRDLLEEKSDIIEFDTTVKYIEKVDAAIKNIEKSNTDDKVPSSKDKKRLNRFFDALTSENSEIHKTIKALRSGRDYGVGLAESYNNIAENLGLPLVPPIGLDMIRNM